MSKLFFRLELLEQGGKGKRQGKGRGRIRQLNPHCLRNRVRLVEPPMYHLRPLRARLVEPPVSILQQMFDELRTSGQLS